MRLHRNAVMVVVSLFAAFFLSACGGGGSAPSPVIGQPTADAGPDNTVDEGQLVTLDGSGSTAAAGAGITGYLWEQLSGPTATLSDNTAVSPTFTAPGVNENLVLRFRLTVTDNTSQTASDNVDITVNTVTWVGFSDAFSTDTITGGIYNPIQTLNPGGTLTYDNVEKRAQVTTGDNMGLLFSHPSEATATGLFKLDFNPTVAYSTHGGIWITLAQDANNYYEIKNFDWRGDTPTLPDIATVKKVVNNVIVDDITFTTGYSEGTSYNLTIAFSPTQVVLTGFGSTITLDTTDTTVLSVVSFEIETGQQDASYDNIILMEAP